MANGIPYLSKSDKNIDLPSSYEPIKPDDEEEKKKKEEEELSYRPKSKGLFLKLPVLPMQTRAGESKRIDIGYTPSHGEITPYRAKMQTNPQQAFNSIIGGIGGGVLTSFENLGYLFDLDNNIKRLVGAEEVMTNAFSKFFKDKKDQLYEALPIYRRDPNAIIDWNDSGFYWSALRSMTESAVGFGISGVAAGKIINATTKALKLAKLLGPDWTALVNTLGTANATNFMEGKMMGLELIEEGSIKAREEIRKELLPQMQKEIDELPLLNPALAEGPANYVAMQERDKQIRAIEEKYKRIEEERMKGVTEDLQDEANKFIARNKVFMLTDAIAVNGMFRGSGFTRNMQKARGIKTTAEMIAKQAPVEYVEEVGQNVFQMEGEYQAKKNAGVVMTDIPDDPLKRALHFAKSEKAQLEGFMGLFGGPLQHVLVTAPTEISTRAERDRYYNEQQDQIANNKDVTELLKNRANIEKRKQDFLNKGDINSYYEIQHDDLANLLFNNAKRGTLSDLEAKIQEAINLTPEQAKILGYEDDYVTRGTEMLREIKEMEKEYIRINRKFSEPGENLLHKRVFDATQKRKFAQNNIVNLNRQINQKEIELTNAAEALYGNIADKNQVTIDQLEEVNAGYDRAIKEAEKQRIKYPRQTDVGDKTSNRNIAERQENKYEGIVNTLREEQKAVQNRIENLKKQTVEAEQKLSKKDFQNIEGYREYNDLVQQRTQYKTAYDVYSNELEYIDKNKVEVMADEVNNLEEEDRKYEEQQASKRKQTEQQTKQQERNAPPVGTPPKKSTVQEKAPKEQVPKKSTEKPKDVTEMNSREILNSIRKRFTNPDGTTAPFFHKQIAGFINSMNAPTLGAGFGVATSYNLDTFLEKLREQLEDKGQDRAINTVQRIKMYFKDLQESIINQEEAETQSGPSVVLSPYTKEDKVKEGASQDILINRSGQIVESGSMIVSHDMMMYRVGVEKNGVIDEDLVDVDGKVLTLVQAREQYPSIYLDVPISEWMVLRDENGEAVPSTRRTDINTDALNSTEQFQAGQTVYFRIKTTDSFNDKLSDLEQMIKQVKIEVYQKDDKGNILVGGYVPMGDEWSALRKEMATEWFRRQTVPYISDEENWKSVIIDKLPGRINNKNINIWIHEFTSERFYLGIAVEQRGITYISVPNAPKDMVEVWMIEKAGPVYFIVETAKKGRYMPARVFTNKVKDVPSLMEKARRIINEVDESNAKNKAVELNSVSPVNFIYQDGLFTYLKTIVDPIEGKRVEKKEGLTREQFIELVGDSIANIELSKINRIIDGVDYNKQLSESHVMSIDIDPAHPFHSAKFIVKPIGKIEGEREVKTKDVSEEITEPGFIGDVVDLDWLGGDMASALIIDEENEVKEPVEKKTVEKERILPDEAIKYLKSKQNPDGTITVYRGVKIGGEKGTGQFWTTNKKVAEWYASVEGGTRGPGKIIIRNITFEEAVRHFMGTEGKPGFAHGSDIFSLPTERPKYFNEVGGDTDDIANRTKQYHKNRSINPEEAVKRLKKMFGNKVPITIDTIEFIRKVTGIQGFDAEEVFTRAALYIHDHAAEGTEFHGAWHVVFRMFTTPEQRTQLLTEAEKRYKKATREELDRIKAEHPMLSDRGVMRQYYEEQMADDFMEFKMADGKEVDNTLTGKIKEFFQTIWQWIKSLIKQDVTIDEMFSYLDKGVFRYRNIIYKDNPYLKTGIKAYMRSPNIGPIEWTRRVNTVNNLFWKVFDDTMADHPEYDGWREIDIIKDVGLDLINVMYKEVYDSIINYEDYLRSNGKLTKDMEEKYDNMLNAFVVGTNKEGKPIFGDLYFAAINDLINYGIKIKFKDNLYNSFDVLEIEESTLDDIEENEKQFESWQIKELQQSKKETLSFKIRRALRNLPLRNPNNLKQEYADDLQLPRLADFHDTYAYLETHLAGTENEEDMMDELKILAEFRPELNTLINNLNNNDELRSQFVSKFQLDHIEYTMVQLARGRTGMNMRVFPSNKNSAFNNLVTRWKENLRDPSRNKISDEDGNIYQDRVLQIIREKNEKPVKNLTETKGYNEYITVLKDKQEVTIADAKHLAKLLMPLGIELTPEAIFAQYKSRPGIGISAIKNFKFFVSGELGLRGLVGVLSKGVNPFEEETRDTALVRNIAKDITRLDENMLQDGFQNVENNQVWGYILPRYLARNINRLKGKNWEEAIKWYTNTKFYQDNPWLDLLFNDETARNEFSWTILDGLRLTKRRGLTYDNMSPQHLELTNLAMYHKDPYSRKKGYVYFRVPVLGDAPAAAYVKFKKFSLNKENGRSEILTKLYKVAVQETKRIEQVKQDQERYKRGELKDNDLIENYHYILKAGKKNFAEARGLKYQFLPFLNDSKLDVFGDQEEVINAIEKWADEEVATYEKWLVDNNLATISDKGVMSSDFIDSRVGDKREFVKDYVYNTKLANMMITQLFAGDLAFYKDSKDFGKRMKEIWSPGSNMNIKGKYLTKTGETITVNPTYNVMYLKDELLPTDHVENIEKALKKLKLRPAQVKQIMAQYTATKHTDSQTYITLPRYRQVMIGFGRWNHRLQDAYDRLLEEKGTTKDIDTVFQPLKPFFYTQLKHDQFDTVFPLQHKNMEFVLLPQMVNKLEKGNVLKDLYEHMIKNNIDATTFTSVVKTGMYGENTMDDIRNNTTKTIELPNSEYRIQQENPVHHIEADNLLGSQLSRLVIADINPETKYDMPSGSITAKQLTDLFQQAVIRNAEIGLTKIMDKFKTIHGVREMLLDEVRTRNLGEQFFEALAIVPDGKGGERFNIPLFLPLQSRRNEQLMSSLFNKNVARQRINGSSLIQVSSFGYSDKLRIRFDKKGNLQYLEAMMPWWSKQYFKDLMDKDGFLQIDRVPEELLRMIAYRIPTEHKYSILPIKVVGFTSQESGGIIILPLELPTISNIDFDVDKLYIMMPNFKVSSEKILPEDDQMIIEGEFQEWLTNNLFVRNPTIRRADILQGDEDKARAEFASTKDLWWDRNDNKFYKIGSTTKIEKVNYASGNEMKAVGEMNKEEVENLIIDLGWSVLTNPEVSAQIFQPGGFKTLNNESNTNPGLRQRILKMQGRIKNYDEDIKIDPMSVMGQIEIFKKVVTGSRMIPMFAIHNANHALLQLTNVNFSDPIRFDGQERKSLHDTQDVNDQLISRNYASGLAASVDNIKEPTLGDLNVNQFTINVIAAILGVGYSEETAYMFINQPIILKLTNAINSKTGIADMEDIMNEFEKVMSTSLNEKKEGIPKIEDNASLNTSDLIKWIEEGKTDTTDQYKVYEIFRRVWRKGQALNNLVAATRPDSRAAWPRISNMESFMRNKESVIGSTYFENLDTLFGENEGQVNYLNRIADMSVGNGLETMSKYFPWAKSAFKSVKESIRARKKGRRLSPQESEFIDYSLLTWIVSNYSYFDHGQADKIVKELPTRLERYKQDNKNEEYVKGFLTHLRFVSADKKKGLPIDRIEFRNIGRTSTEEQTKFRLMWESMLNNGTAEEKKLANDLILYTFFINGLVFGPNSFHHLVPVGFFSRLRNDNISFVDYLYKILDEAETEDNIYDDFTDEFYRHAYSRPNFVPISNETNSSIVQRKNGITQEILVDPIRQKGLVVSIDQDGNAVMPPFIARYEGGGTYLYMLYRQDEKGATYIITDKKGIPNYVMEYDRAEGRRSIFKFNHFNYTPKGDPTDIPIVKGSVFGDEAKQTPAAIDEPRNEVDDSDLMAEIGEGIGSSTGILFEEDVDNMLDINEQDLLEEVDDEIMYDYDSLFDHLKSSDGISQFRGNLYITRTGYAQAIRTVADINRRSPGLITIKTVPHKGEYGRTIYAVLVNTETLAKNKKLRDGLQLNLFELNEEAKGKVNEELNKVLVSFLTKFGVSIEDINNYKGKRGVTSRAVSDLINKILYVNEKKMKGTTLPHETGHFAIALLKDKLLVQRMLELVDQSPVYDRVKVQYPHYTDQEQRIEAAGQILGEVIREQFSEQHKPAIVRLAQKIWQMFLDLFRSSNVKQYRDDIRKVYGEVANMVLKQDVADIANFDEAHLEKSGVNELEEVDEGEEVDLSNIQKIVSKTILTVQNKIRLYRERGEKAKEYIEREKNIEAELFKSLQEGKEISTLVKFIESVRAEMKWIAGGGKNLGKLGIIRKRLMKDPDADPNVIARLLRDVKNYAIGYKPILDMIRKELNRAEITGTQFEKEYEILEEAINEIQNKMDKVEKQYYEVSIPVFANAVQPFLGDRKDQGYGKNFNKTLEEELRTTDKDISFWSRWLDAVAESPTDALKALDKFVKMSKEPARRETYKIQKDLIALQKKLQDAGVKDTEWMAERLSDGKLSGYFISEYNTGEFENERKKFAIDLNKKYGIKVLYDDEMSIRDKFIETYGDAWEVAYTKWKKEWNKWYRDNTKSLRGQELRDALEKKLTQFKEEFGDEEGQAMYNDWYETNTYKPPTLHYRVGRNELQKPADKYKNDKFNSILNPKTEQDKLKKEYYDKVVGLKNELEGMLPEIFRHRMLMPQLRKDFVERIKNIRSTKEGARLWESVKEQFMITEDESTIGRQSSRATNEEGKPANFLPIYYTQKLKNMDDLSLDVTSLMSNYAYMALNYQYMDRIIDILELGKDVIQHQEIVETDIKGRPIKEFYRKAGEKINDILKRESRGSFTYQRLQDYYDMVIYGKLRMRGKPLFKGSNIDSEKLIDFLGSYVAVNNLALNIYAGLQNPLYGNAMIRMEGMAGEYVSNKDLIWASKTYWGLLPRDIAQIGNNYQTNKLAGYMEFFDVLQDFRSNLMGMDTNRKTWFGKMFNLGSLFFMNNMGEHYMQGRMSLALAHNTRITDKGVMGFNKYLRLDEKWTKLDNKRREIAISIKEEGENKLRREELFNELNDIKNQVAERKKEVNNEFYKFSSFYSAFHMNGNKFELKEEFKDRVKENDITKFILKQHAINKRLHGIYNEIDRNAIQRYAIGRLAIMFRKFARPGFNRRFESLTYNEELEDFTDGLYTSSVHFMRQLSKDIFKGMYLARADWELLSERERMNFIRTLTEVSYMLSAAVTATLLRTVGEPDDDEWIKNMMAYQANRLYTELRFYSSMRELLKIIKSPAAAISTWQKVSNLLSTMSSIRGWTEEIQSGKYKGMMRVERQAIEVIPLAKTITDWVYPSDKMMYFSTTRNY